MKPFLLKLPSKIHGLGIFTSRDIREKEEFYIVPTNQVFHKATPKCAYIGNNTWVSDEQVLNYVNHSCEPSALLKVMNTPRLISRRLIRAEEEITVDYNLTEQGGNKVPCNCRSQNCRGYFLRRE